MHNINELIRIIKKIDFNGVLNNIEVVRLQLWLNKNRNLAFEPHQMELVWLVDTVLEDKIITDYERGLMLAYSENFLRETTDEMDKIYELNRIIDNIIRDGKVNEAEVYSLKEWMDTYRDFIRNHKTNKSLCQIVDDILEDRIVTQEEQEQLLQMLSDRISGSQFEKKLEYLRKQVKAKKNIGIDLIDILDNEDAIDKIHNQAESQLRKTLFSYTGSYLTDPEVVVISLVLIAMLQYDGNYYENVRATYEDLYHRFSQQKIEGLIRSILNRYRSDDEIQVNRSRIINVALKNAIVPSYYLSAFFEFIYDIYKLNFEYDLPSDLYENFQFVYEGLRNIMLSEGNDVQIKVTQKSYKLIESTKQMIANGKYLDQVIKLSIVIVKLIDKRIWNKDVKIFNPYLKKGYEGWARSIKNDPIDSPRREKKSEFRSRWEPKFILGNNSVYLVPPIHKVKAQYNYSDIHVVVLNDNQQVYENVKPDIREIIGGYLVSMDKIKISMPLGKIVYRLMAGNVIIYDSRDKLHRRFIVFDMNGFEIQDNTDYKGTVVFCYQKDHDKLEPFYNNSQYKLASRNVGYSDVYVIEDTVFNFSSLIRPGIFGTEYENHFLLLKGEETKICVYKEVDFLVFESDNIFAKYEIVIDNKSHKLSDFKNTVTEREGICKYVVALDISDPGIYSVIVNQMADGKRNMIAKFTLGLDPCLEVDELKLDDNTYMVDVKTDLSAATVNADICVNNFMEDEILIEYGGKTYSYCIPFHFDIYRLNGEYWRPFVETIWIGDISQDSTMDIYGADVDGLLIYADTGELLEEEIKFKGKGVYQQISVGFLLSYKISFDYLVLVFTKNGKRQREIFCYNKCILNEDEMEISFEFITKTLFVTTSFYGKGNIYFEIFNQKNESIYKSGYLESKETEKVSNLRSFEKYRICFYEEIKDWIFKENRLMKQYDRIFYAREDFVGRSFKINEVYFNQLVRGEFLEKSHYFNTVYVCFLEKVAEDTFLGEIYTKTSRGVYMLDRLNPVEIEICSEVIDKTMDLYITKDGDGLLLDFEHHRIKNTLDDDSATDIFFYTIDADGVETF